jgi:chromosome segregation ATPase
MAFRFVALFLTSFLLLFAVACSDDDDNGGSATGSTGSSDTGNTGARPPASRPDYCDELDAVRADVDELQSAMRSLNRSAAESAVQDLRTDLDKLRDAARGGGDNEEIDQAAEDLSGAVDGLETTLRQATQGEASLTGVIQELEIQVPAIMSSLNDLMTEARCN